jgi:hypothetical protein
MTRIQRLEERARRDDKMCAEINGILDSHEYSQEGLAHALGWIAGCLEAAGRREKRDFVPVREGDAGEAEKAAG